MKKIYRLAAVLALALMPLALTGCGDEPRDENDIVVDKRMVEPRLACRSGYELEMKPEQGETYTICVDAEVWEMQTEGRPYVLPETPATA